MGFEFPCVTRALVSARPTCAIRIALALLALGSAHGAGDAVLDRATLRGLPAFNVVVDKMDDELVRQGISPGSLRSRAEERLRQAGLPVDANADAFVGIRLVQVRDRRGPFGVCINVGMYQQVGLVRDAKVKTATQTWEVETVMLAEPKLVNGASQESLDELVDRLIAAWKSVNPKP